MPKVSVIVTAYNIEKYIRQSLDSVIGQTLDDIEIIVVDDGSSDATPDIIREYAARDSRIRPILFDRNTIGGVASAANAGMDVATGDYIGFADGDDLYDPTMFEKLWQAAESTGSDLAMCRYTLLDESDGSEHEPAETDRWQPFPRRTALDLTDATRKQMLRFISVPWRKIYRRDLVERINLRFPVGDFFFEDNPFHWASVIGGERIVLLPERLCKHRVARAGQTMATVDERLLRIFYHHDIIHDWLRQNDAHDGYKDELLRWTAAQLSWVSQRAEGEMQKLLFDRLVPIAAQYSTDDIAAFGHANGRGRSVQMLEQLGRKDFAGFSRAAGWTGGQTPARLPGAAPGGTLLSRGWYHLRASGPRQTAAMTGRYLSERFGLRSNTRDAAPRDSADKIDNTDLMAAMVILQKELRLLRAEVAELRRRTPSDDDLS
ncbi:MAG: glycosyltransferase family 2 protein [Paracoccus sp. (in: a-proteobacteria)]|uniref:glycosyltransferase family 2 protein n=1 Tax=Paracoccus sp. TaxID=267 RepID=UPI0026DEEE94|nr:glycosyltransferase family 2 protein [Paracoccus sp. (in: a-proteobacteria)]MDO5612562.1 glycosyltransferase family 2 protein [Paracoccus sp. (in: a-proteobacteria)]